MVTIPDRPFLIGNWPVTQLQWKTVMGKNPSHCHGGNLPVEQVSWNDAQEFCKKLSQMMGKIYRLPKEAEWEYACRAGSTGKYCYGNDERLLKDYAWYKDNSGGATHHVGQKKPNAWGLYDMHGNVWEWCEDLYQKGSEYRVVRGGSYADDRRNCGAASRDDYPPDYYLNNIGFRLACGPSS